MSDYFVTLSIKGLSLSRSEVFLGKGALKICSKFRGEHQCQRAISIKLQSNDDSLSKYIIWKQHSCSIFILLLLAQLWPIHTRGQ